MTNVDPNTLKFDALAHGHKPIVLMNRTDGLGERLCAMINAVRLADALERDFRFFWTSDIWNPVYHVLATEKEKPVLGQSVAPQEAIFSPSFISDYSLKEHDSKQYRACPAAPITHAKIARAEEHRDFLGWVPDQNFLEGQCDPSFLKTIALSSGQAFERLDFCMAIDDMITAATQVKVPSFDAIHLRSGDMVFGEVRKWGQWGNKVLSPSVARDLIAKIQGEGRQVVLFGQDVDGLTALAKEHDCLFVATMMPDMDLSSTQRAFFEMMLMSRAQQIYAGYSGFSRAACMIGNKLAKTPNELYTQEQYIDITLADLRIHADAYHPLVTAYSYWQIFDMGAQFLNLPEQYQILVSAAQKDPANLLYPVLQSALLYRMGRDEDAEGLIAQQIKARPVDGFLDQLTFKYYSTGHTHRHQFDAFRGAARRAGNVQAKICAEAIQKALA